MNLESERKIKFWLSTISKVLIIALIAFKLIPFFADTTNDSSRNKVKTIKDDSDKIVDTTGLKQNESAVESADLSTEDKSNPEADKSLETSRGNEEEGEFLKKTKSMGNSIGIFIFDDDTVDNTIARQLEKTILEPYDAKSTSSSTNKSRLLSGDIEGYYETAIICVGNVSYTFRNKGNTTSCELRLNFDTYDTKTGIKIKEHSRSILRNGIGFSQEEARTNAIKKIH